MEQAPVPIISQRFDCAICDKEAATISLFGSESGATCTVYGFIGEMRAGVALSEFKDVLGALKTKDVVSLFAIDFEFAPFYCPKCKVSYCKNHWSYWFVDDEELPHMYDCTKGRCPEGHERMLID